MTEQGNVQPRGPFSWLKDIFRVRPKRPPIIVRKRDVDAETLEVQIEIIRRAFDEKIGVAMGRDGVLEFLYHPERALMRSEDVEQVQRFFTDRPDVYRNSGDSLGEPVDGVVLYLMPPRHDDGEVHLLDDLDELDREIRVGVATPDHILYVVGTPGKVCPATEPDPPTTNSPMPAVNKNPGAGKGVRVSVVDTGWYPGAATDTDSPWLAKDVDGDVEQVGATIGEYAGHGTFVAGVLRCIAPETKVRVEGFLTKGGAVYESEITKQLNEAMTDRELRPQIITISAGTHTRKDLGLLGFEVLSLLYKFGAADEGPLVVAAAGNDNSKVPFYPAAFDWVVGVGSLDADGKRSTFSNYGTWVNAYAQGNKLVNAYPTGSYKYVEPASGTAKVGTTANFTGLAQWSGTSFSTPIVTGAIAEVMSGKGITARQAKDALLAAAPVKQDQLAGNMKALGPPFM